MSSATTEMSSTPLDSLLPLCQVPAGSVCRVRALAGDAAFCQRVREMGFGESAFVTKISGTVTILCQVAGTRIALRETKEFLERNQSVEKVVFVCFGQTAYDCYLAAVDEVFG